MAPPKSNELTQRDLEIAGLIWKCFKTQPQIDFQKLADLGKFKNAASASACWAPIKKKLMGQVNAEGGGRASAASTPASSRNKRKAKDVQDDGDDDEDPATPTPKAKRTKKAASSARRRVKSPAYYENFDDDKEAGNDAGIKSEAKGEDDGEMLHDYFAQFDPEEPYA